MERITYNQNGIKPPTNINAMIAKVIVEIFMKAAAGIFIKLIGIWF